MTKILLSFIYFFLLLSTNIFAQETFTGKVIDKETHSPIENSTVTVYQGDSIKYQTTSDSIGNFKVPGLYLRQDNTIKIHALNYTDLKTDIKKWGNNSNNFLGTFSLVSKKISLEEVVVKSNKRYRDTTRIDLSKTKFERSVMIDDIFSNDFGLTKDVNGQLYYKGKPVSNIVVNGGDFFGKNNMDIYHLLPALILSRIEVVETNIDSTTNTTSLRPTITINLNLKEKYDKGKFGNANLGIGTANRGVANTDIFKYKNKEQISLTLNTNNINIGDNTMQEPNVSFSANGNNLTTNSTKFTYRNIYDNKIEVSFDVKGKIENKNIASESERQDETINAFSKTFSSSKTKSFDIDDTKLNINYKVDSLNSLNITQIFNHSYARTIDSSIYFIKLDSATISSDLNKLRSSNTDLFNTQIGYQKKYSAKKGRLLNIGFDLKHTNYDVSELAKVNNSSGQNLNNYFISGERSVTENIYTVNFNFTEPFGENGYINFFVDYEKDRLNYKTQINSDTLITSTDAPSLIGNQYFRPGIKFQRTFNKVSLDARLTEVLNLRDIEQAPGNVHSHFLNFNADIRADYKIDSKKSLSLGYTDVTNYPDVTVLTNLNSTFSLISQNIGNNNLKPEQAKSIKLSYNTRPSESENISIAGEFHHFDQKFGLAIINSNSLKPGNILENATEENVGSSNGGQVSFSLLKTVLKDKYFNFSAGIAYQESPTVINNKLILNNNITVNQSLSTSIIIIKSLLSTTPLIATSFSKYFYETNSINITTLTYSDKLSFTLKTLQLDLYPLINYNHSINNNTSFSMNGEIKKNVFKGYGSIWLQTYDIFNSFKYINNYIGASGYQSVKYSNLSRYLLLGINFKFNNMK
ncbi:MAG: outer membrane beta-barrel protein [Bacteroidota bacterium]|nr:outer membrane beta-barrel protein [Bacteroidota bacterium]